MDWLPPIEVSRISYGGKVRPHKELSDPHSVRFFSKIWFDPFPFCLNLHSLSMRNPKAVRPRYNKKTIKFSYLHLIQDRLMQEL